MSTTRFRSLHDPETLRLLVLALGEGIYITNDQGEFLDANPAFLEIFGVGSLEELRRYRAQDLYVDPELRGRQLAALARDGEVRDFELQIRRPDGDVRTLLDTCYTIRDPDGDGQICHGILVDITRRKQLEEELQELSRRDPLTGCFNRRFLAEMTERWAEEGGGWGVIVLDVDDFKRYNDEYGHRAGDEVLVRTSRFLLGKARAEDAVVRMGGDEFAVLLREARGEDLAEVARRLQGEAGRAGLVPFSLGWATYRSGETLEQTIDRADLLLLDRREQEGRPDRHYRRAGDPPPDPPGAGDDEDGTQPAPRG
jgi:diguanylate cyclase (GGDEF)-like protein/PAS domain S-box-containing protein